MSNIGSISYINQNQVVAIDNQAKLQAKLIAETEILPDAKEVAVIEESSESAKANTDFDEEKSYDEKGGKKDGKNKKRAEFFGVVIEDDEENSEDTSENRFDRLV